MSDEVAGVVFSNVVDVQISNLYLVHDRCVLLCSDSILSAIVVSKSADVPRQAEPSLSYLARLDVKPLAETSPVTNINTASPI